jgi:hypothetical protein
MDFTWNAWALADDPLAAPAGLPAGLLGLLGLLDPRAATLPVTSTFFPTFF